MDFSALKELVQIISRNRVKHIAVLGNPGQEGKRTDKLYDILSKGKVESDLEAARALLGREATKNHTYNRIRQRLTKQLVNSVFFMDFDKPQYVERLKAYYYCYKDLAAALLLTIHNGGRAATSILVQILENSNKFEFLELKVQTTYQLCRIFSREKYDRAEYKHFFSLYKEYEFELRWVRKSFIYYEELVQIQLLYGGIPQMAHQKGMRFLGKLAPHEKRIKSIEFHFHFNSIASATYAVMGQHKLALYHANKLHALFQANSNFNRGAAITPVCYIIASYIQLQIEDNANIYDIYLKSTNLITKNSTNWLILTTHYIVFLIHQQNWTEILVCIEELQSIAIDLTDNPVFAEFRTLLSGYLFLLAAFGKIPREPLEEVFGPFRIGKFLNSFTLFPREKHARNIPIILLPLLFALAEGKTKYKGPSPEALHKYRQRRLETEQNRRSAIFVRLLLAQVDKLDNPDDTRSAERRIETELAALRALPMKDVPQPHMVEIIPYEHLWEMLTERAEERDRGGSERLL